MLEREAMRSDARAAPAEDRRPQLAAHVVEAQRQQLTREAVPELAVEARVLHDPDDALPHADGGRGAVARIAEEARRIGEQGVAVEVLDDDPSTRPERGHEPPQDVAPLRQMLEDEPTVDEVEVRLGEGVGADVVPQGSEVRLLERVEEARVEVGRDDASRLAHAPAEPLRDRATAATDLEAAPSGAHADGVEMPPRTRVEHRLEAREPLPLLLPGVVEDVGAHGSPRIHANFDPAGGRRQGCPPARSSLSTAV